MTALAKLLDAFRPPMPSGKEHLVYRDVPKLQLKLWNWLKEVLGPYEFELLTEAHYKTQKYGTLSRGQFFVHPDGLKEICRRAKEMTEEDMNKLLKNSC